MDTGHWYLLAAFLTGMLAGGVYGWKRKEMLGDIASQPHFFKHFGIIYMLFALANGIAWTVLFGWGVAVFFSLMLALYCAGPFFMIGSALGRDIRLMREECNSKKNV